MNGVFPLKRNSMYQAELIWVEIILRRIVRESIPAELEVSYSHPASDIVLTVSERQILLRTVLSQKILATQIYTGETSISLVCAFNFVPTQYNEFT